MSIRTLARLLGVFGFFVGFGLLIWVDWRIALGVLCTHWANNVRLALDGLPEPPREAQG